MKIRLFVMTLATIMLSSCGGGGNNKDNSSNEPVLKASQTELKGDLKGCYEVVDKNYKLTTDGYGYDLVIELKRTSKELPCDRKNIVNYGDAEESKADFCGGFGLEVLDENGDVIDKCSAKSPYSRDEIDVALQLLPDETTTIRFCLYEKEVTNATSFRISSLVEENNKRKTAADELIDVVSKSAKELGNDLETKETKEALETAGKMLDVLGDLAK